MKLARVFLGSIFSVLVLSLSVYAVGDSEGVFFGNLINGQKVKSPFKVQMLVSGKTVAPAGEIKPGTGHHHIIVDGGPVEAGKIIIADQNHIHFGKGQTEAELTLSPGKHTLTLQFADGMHLSYGKDWSATVEVVVE